MSRFLKILAINILIIFSILGALNYLPPLAMSSYAEFLKFKSEFRSTSKKDFWLQRNNVIEAKDRINLPNYKNHKWISKYIQEYENFNQQNKFYSDFTNYRSKSFSGETINVDSYGIRKTYTIPQEKIKVWFFGGSTMWGSGSNDSNTIPSQFTKISAKNSLNLGESGYHTRHNLNMLMNNFYKREKPEFVVFYDGVNNILSQCQSDRNPPASNWEKQIDERLRSVPPLCPRCPLSFKYQLNTPATFIKIIKNKILPSKEKNVSLYNCHNDLNKAKSVAQSFISDWTYASYILKPYGIKFIPILQPVLYFSKTKKEHLSLVAPEIIGQQYKAVYPLIIKGLEKKDLKYYNLLNVFDLDEWIYIDLCHVSPNGNKIIAENINKILRSL